MQSRPPAPTVACGLLGLMLINFCAEPLALGQALPAQCQELDRLRDQPLREADDQILDACIDAEFQQLQANMAAPESGRAFVERMLAQYRNRENTPAFRQRWVERINQRFLTEFSKAKPPDVSVLRPMARLVSQLESVQCRDALLAGLKFEDSVARFYAARGLTRIRNDISADARLTENTLGKLVQANIVERNGVVAAELYRAMDYEDPSHAERIRTQLLDVFQGRLRRMANGAAPPDRAELAALEVLRRVLPDAPTAFKSSVVSQLAVLLRLHVERLIQGGMDMYARAAVEETILEVEELLKDILGTRSVPSVNAVREKGGAAMNVDIQIELNRWIGTPEAPGVLTAPPWNVPIGAS